MESFNVFIDGACLPGFDAADVVPQLARMTGQPEERARRLLAGKPIQVKSNVDAATSQRFVQALQRIGVAAHAEPDRLELDADYDVPELTKGAPEVAAAAAAASTPTPAPPPSPRGVDAPSPAVAEVQAVEASGGTPKIASLMMGLSVVLLAVYLFNAGDWILQQIHDKNSSWHRLAQYLPASWLDKGGGAASGSGGKTRAPSASAGKRAADQLIADRLRSPASYQVVEQDVLWSVSTGTYDAYLIRTEYDAANGFGALLRGCYYATFKLEGGQIRYNPVHAVSPCDKGETSWPNWKHMIPVVVKTQLEGNNLESLVTDDMRYAAEAGSAAALGKPVPPRPAAGAGAGAGQSAAPAAPGPTTAVASSISTPDRYESRFGLLTAARREKDARVLVGGRLALETVLGEYTFERALMLRSADIVLVANFRPIGMGCLQTYTLLAVTEAKTSVSPAFGTCSSEPTLVAEQDTIVVTQNDDAGKPHTYRWRDGKLTDNGIEIVER